MDRRALLPHQLPHASTLFCDFAEHFDKVASFYSHTPSTSAAAECARKLRFPVGRRREIATLLTLQNEIFGSGPETERNLQRLANGAVAVLTGQQVGLFGGPAYAFYKAISAIQLAAELTRRGIEAVPIFWLATEDHDADEVRQVLWFERGELRKLELGRTPEEGVPVGRVRLGSGVETLVEEVAPGLGRSLAAILRDCYTPQATYSSAFAALFARIFSGHGLILLDPIDERLHRLAAPLLHAALADRDDLNELLLQRAKELDRDGYRAQVKVTSRSTLLFFLDNGKRRVLRETNGGFQCGPRTLPREEWLQLVLTAPHLFSPNALLRPVVQDYLLPTVAYFGGPAEIAYYAQSQVLYRKLLRRMPVLLPRAEFTLVDPKALRLLKKYGLQVEDVWRGPQQLRTRMFDSRVPKKLAREFDVNLRRVEAGIQRLHKSIARVDPTLQDPLVRVRKRISYQLEKLRHKTGAALDRRDKQSGAHADFLLNLLYPHKNFQSRSLSFLPFLARWGSGALTELRTIANRARPGWHYIVPIP